MSQDPLGTAECRLGQVDHHHEHDHDHHDDHQNLTVKIRLLLQSADLDRCHFLPTLVTPLSPP